MAIVGTGLSTPGIRSEFFSRFDEVNKQTHWADLSTRLQARTKSENYRWLGSVPPMREWGTGRKARALRGPLAGKTGTTNNYHDALFVGFSPAVAAGVWVGMDLGGTMGDRETGSRAALPIWMDFMNTALADGSQRYFDLPENTVKKRINPNTGNLAVDGSTAAVTALFKKGTEPR